MNGIWRTSQKRSSSAPDGSLKKPQISSIAHTTTSATAITLETIHPLQTCWCSSLQFLPSCQPQPSGPIALPLVLLIFAKGHRIDATFPLSHMGPAILQLVYVSALAFKNQAEKDLHYAVLEASTVSGILHASTYLDYIILPYYTGFEALTMSTFSGECATCVCRENALVVGGSLISYRGCSKTTMSIICVLFSRMVCKIFGEEKLSLLINSMLEAICWLLIASDSITLMFNSPQGGVINMVVYGGVCVLISLIVFRRVCSLLAWLAVRCQIQKKIDLYYNNAGIV